MDGGYTSVMIDGSSLPYEQNVELTREVVKLAHPYGVTVEGELGVLAGVEDHVFSATSTYTNPMQAVDFFKKTGCRRAGHQLRHVPRREQGQGHEDPPRNRDCNEGMHAARGH